MTALADLDVVVLTRNRPHEALAAVESVRRQEGVVARAWIVDQGSDEASLSVLRGGIAGHEHAHLVELGRNLGVPGGRNHGNGLGRAGLIVSLDDDAELDSPGELLRVAERFASEPRLGALGFRILVAATGEDDRLSWVYPRQLWPRRGEPFTATRFCGAGHALRREAWARTRGYDERLFFYWEELDLACQLVEHGFTIAYDPGVRVRHKISPVGRRDWGGERFYYLARNALYLEWRHHRSPSRLLVRGAGYLAKGAYNRVLPQALRALRELPGMLRAAPAVPPLGPEARRYIEQHDLVHRGGLVTRLRREVFERLPGGGRPGAGA
jgi:GT2 family glycosyltransferase